MNPVQALLNRKELRLGSEPLADPRTLNLRKRTNWRPVVATPIACLAIWLWVRTNKPEANPLAYLLMGVILGLAFVGFRAVDEKIRLRNFLLNALAHAVIYSLMLTTAFGIILGLGAFMGKVTWSDIVALRETYALAYAGFLVWMFILFSVVALSRKLGRKVLWNWLRGYYYQPKREERVVMFLDLQGSTELADRLGDERFSEFVRDFFADLTWPVVRCSGEISHYIGDEAVITWKVDSEPIPARALQCFFAFQQVLASKADRYESKYGCVPVFKAGIQVGQVVITEVGEVKSEFVLHGDTLNVASRIQGLCGKLGEKVLLSSALAARIRPEQWFELQEKGEEHVKGKAGPVAIVAAHITGA